MKFCNVLLLLTSASTIAGHPVINTCQANEEEKLEPRAYKSQHGVCSLWVELTELLPRQNPPRSDISVRITDGKQVSLSSLTWWNGYPISERQGLNETIFLNDIIEPGSELRIDWTNVDNKSSRIKDLDWLQFEYTLHRGGTENAAIVFNDRPEVEDWGFARCRRIGGGWEEHGKKEEWSRMRKVECDFNC